jgi:hypothetical protein
MATFPDIPAHPRNPQVGTGGFVAPGAPTIQPNPLKPKVASLFTPQPGGNQTLQALMLRQKELAGRGGEMPQIQSWTQGLSHALAETMTGIEEGRVRREAERGNAAVAGALGAADPVTGLVPAEAASSIASWDPEMAYKLLSDRREQMNADAVLAAQKEKLAADQSQVGAWKPSDIAARADDYTKAAATYETAAPSWQSMQESFNRVKDLTAGSTAPGAGTADYNLVVGLAKLLDPNSVVREGEVKSTADTGGAIDRLNVMLASLGPGGAGLSPEVRRSLMTEANGRMKAYYDQAAGKRQWISEVATRHGVNPDDVVPPLAPYVPWTPPEQDDPNKLPDDPEAAAAAANAPLPDPPDWYNPAAWPTPEEWAGMTPEQKAKVIKLSTTPAPRTGG